MAATRLRKTFQYPDDSDQEPIREEYDEQEQEQLIQRLQVEHDVGNEKYSAAFAAIPLLSAAVFLPSIVLPSSSVFERFLGLISATSLAMTAYAMRTFGTVSSHRNLKKKTRTPGTSETRWIFPVNVVACALLCVVYAVISPELLHNITTELYLVPAAMFSAITATQRIMDSVDLSVLEGLRYEYKGP